ncbi:GNAT family protein [Halomonas sp. HP20-15]|uniref:GNAT family N-acetyltransferase n=1 Tax=Halomonas sp. HP20-15 TaxID=3085901 RepID=UPI002982AAC5|nr:GNAT family protein [Halomonas sp. HP20-15]MDW5376434.1 GNAT family protein [Halomonas sp. HP20-15]
MPCDPSIKLRPARVDDLDTVLGWVPDAEVCRRWAGPNVAFPGTPNGVWLEMAASPDNAFALIDGAALVGFGQLLARDYRVVHMARLIVAPRRRGQGLGRRLCEALIETARDDFAARRLTLNVYADNHVAHALYSSLGFRELLRDDAREVILMSRTNA